MGRHLGLSSDFRRPGRRGLVILAAGATALALTACGGGGTHFKNAPRPPVTVDLSVYIDNSHVSISPTKVGAGPAILYVTNQASRTATLAVRHAGGGAVASSGHINSGQTAQVPVELRTGTYDIASGTKIPPAKLKITRVRPNADNALLQP